jgi:hypothetical protein
MPRIFLSHFSNDNSEATALRQWLIDQRPELVDEIFLDIAEDAGLAPGQRWKDALRQANQRCEAVICLVSHSWGSSPECKTEYRTAETLGKQILVARLEDTGDSDITAEWQRCDLFAPGPTTEITVSARRCASNRGAGSTQEGDRGDRNRAGEFRLAATQRPAACALSRLGAVRRRRCRGVLRARCGDHAGHRRAAQDAFLRREVVVCGAGTVGQRQVLVPAGRATTGRCGYGTWLAACRTESPSRGTPARSTAWRSALTGSAWPAPARTKRRGYGTPPAAGRPARPTPNHCAPS